jgi:biotin transport system permease protein
MLFLYIPRPTWLHRLPPGAKLVGLAIASIAALACTRWEWLAVGLLMACAAYLSLGADGRRRLMSLRSLLPLVLGLGAFQWLVMDWQSALLSMLRMLLMIAVADLVTITTTMQQMLATLMPLVRPARRLGLDPWRLSLAVALMVRFVPVLLAQWSAQRDAWTSRSPRKAGFTLLIPFLRETLRRTDTIAESIASRSRRR